MLAKSRVRSRERKQERRDGVSKGYDCAVATNGGRSAVFLDLSRAALAYAKRGVPVSPCEPGGKRPLTKNGFWDATVEEREIRAWWGRWPHANVAIPTGQASGLMVLDADAGDGPKSLRRLELEVGRVPETLVARTGGGGSTSSFASRPGPAGRSVTDRGSLGLALTLGPRGLRAGSAQPDIRPL